MHPSLQFTRLGAHLREHAQADDTVGQLARTVLTNADHEGNPRLSEPLELTPLHALRDEMLDQPEHPLAKVFDWEQVPEGVALDSAMVKAVNDHNNSLPSNADYTHNVSPLMVRMGGSHPPQQRAVSKILNHLRELFNGQLSINDIDHAAMRMQLKLGRETLSRYGDDEEEHTLLAKKSGEDLTAAERFPHRQKRAGW